MAAIHGVETNVASRFIDHTVATPWESLLNDIESALRTVSKAGEIGVKVDIFYNGLTYRLEKRRSANNQKKIESTVSVKSDRVKDFTWLHSAYNIGWFVLFSQGHNSADYHASYRTTMLSAFVTVVKMAGSGLNISLPIFFSHSYVTDISQAADLIGYQNLSAPGIAAVSSTETIIKQPQWCRYEAHICPMLYCHPHFEYFDGIRKILQNQLRKLRLGGPAADNFLVDSEFSFLHEPDTIYGSIGGTSILSSSSHSSGRAECSAKATGVSVFNASFLKRLAALIPSDEISCTLLTEILIELSYPSQPQHLITDNVQRTTFLPSQQPPNSWNIALLFKNLPRVSLGDLGVPSSLHNNTRNAYALTYHSAGSDHALSASWMSLSVRKLLSFYILSVYCTRAKVNVETMSAEIEATTNLLDKNVLDRVNEVLSDETRAVFYTVCRQQIDPKFSTPGLGNSNYPNPSTPKGRMASVQKDIAPINLTSLGSAASGVTSPTRGGRTASIVTGSASVANITSNGGSHSPTPASLNAVSTNLFGGEDGGWSARMERHRAVVEILFSGECVFSAQVSQGSQLDCPVSTSVGLWMGMFSLLCASSAVDAHDMANIWSKCMRRVHIACEDGQPLPTFTPATSATETSNAACAEAVSESNTPICLRTMWDDAIERLHEEDTQRSSSCQGGLPLAWPDQQESVVVQKLQQLQFCIATQNESPLYQFPTSSVEVEVVERETSTSPNIAESGTTGAPQESVIKRRYTVQQPTLFRRLPLTEDMIAMNKYLARKLNLSNSRSNREHPTLKVQLQVPSILSDIKAFKAANPELDMHTFCAWYGIEPIVEPMVEPTVASEDQATPQTASTPNKDITTSPKSTPNTLKIPLEDISRAWASYEAVACEDQGRALFLVEKESEKAMAYLESVTAVQLASEMLGSGIKLIFGILAKQFDPWLCEDDERENKAGKQSEKGGSTQTAALNAQKNKLRSDLALLKEQVENAVSSLRPEPTPEVTSSSATSNAAAQAELNINTLIFVDSVAGLIQKLETLSIKLQTLGSLFARSSTASVDGMVHSLSRKDTFTAETDGERNAMYELTRALHCAKEQIHDAQSRDGRELGEPTKKSFTCRLHPPRGPVPNAAAVPVSLLPGTTRGFSVEPPSILSQGGAPQQPMNSAAAPALLNTTSSLRDVFHMQATVKQRQNLKEKQLHVAFRVPEGV
eukprot:gene10343-12095_t